MEHTDTFNDWQARLKTGFGPKKSEPLPTWRAPDLTEQEQQERDQLIKTGTIPF